MILIERVDETVAALERYRDQVQKACGLVTAVVMLDDAAKLIRELAAKSLAVKS